MIKIFSFLKFLIPWKRNSNAAISTEHPDGIKQLQPLNFTKFPELRQLQESGAGPSKLRVCQQGFSYFQERGFPHTIPELTEAYNMLIKTDGTKSGHLVFFNHLISVTISNEGFNMSELAASLSEKISEGLSPLDLYKITSSPTETSELDKN